MIIIKHPSDLQNFVRSEKSKGQVIGFAPTMGALHEGHLQLVKTAAERSSAAICSIFVNPTQFNDPEDFRKYPQRLENDIYLLNKTSADILFIPSVNDIYPSGTGKLERFELGYLDSILEARFRPGHFQGVCQVMSRLLRLVNPDLLFMGSKDYQQCMVIKKLIADLGLPISLIACPTVREADGLAMSSRNLRLSAEERKIAPEIYKTLQYIRDEIKAGNLGALALKAKQRLEQKHFRVDYIAFADRDSLQLVEKWDGAQPLVALVAAFLNEVRLIDNLAVNA
ncbi:MAG: pantoate--beta-alanine ligase [Chitinophagaceae bacterium]|nr:pantoate--beta-alanine ligase [Chitinophagaceae bacterium]